MRLTFHVSNDHAAELEVDVEPWCFPYFVPRGSKLTFQYDVDAASVRLAKLKLEATTTWRFGLTVAFRRKSNWTANPLSRCGDDVRFPPVADLQAKVCLRPIADVHAIDDTGHMFAAIIRWIDREWETLNARFSGPLVAICPWFVALFFKSQAVAIVIAAVWSAFWTVLFGWRGAVWLRKLSREGDRQYDLQGKFKLAKDYWTTESATAAAARRDRERKRRKRNG